MAELEDWRAIELNEAADRSNAAADEEIVSRMGCARDVRLAGPFGHGAAPDSLRSYPAEEARPWPAAWPPDPVRGTVPHVLSTRQKRCLAVADEQVSDGVFYAEAFFEARGDTELVVAVQGAVAVWIDGTKVLEGTPREVLFGDKAEGYGVAVPAVTEVQKMLARDGFASQDVLLTPAELAEELEVGSK